MATINAQQVKQLFFPRGWFRFSFRALKGQVRQGAGFISLCVNSFLLLQSVCDDVGCWCQWGIFFCILEHHLYNNNKVMILNKNKHTLFVVLARANNITIPKVYVPLK